MSWKPKFWHARYDQINFSYLLGEDFSTHEELWGWYTESVKPDIRREGQAFEWRSGPGGRIFTHWSNHSMAEKLAKPAFAVIHLTLRSIMDRFDQGAKWPHCRAGLPSRWSCPTICIILALWIGLKGTVSFSYWINLFIVTNWSIFLIINHHN